MLNWMDTKKIFEKKKDSVSIQDKFHKYALLIVSAIKKTSVGR